MTEVTFHFNAPDKLGHACRVLRKAVAAGAKVVVTGDGALLNLGSAVPEGFERFERLIEVVTVQEEERQLGRRRWKHYAERGYAIKSEDLAPKETR